MRLAGALVGCSLLLARAAAADAVLRSASPERRDAIERQLAVCEASDWFWWFGDYNPAESVRDFDQLYRHQLASLYKLLELPQPERLSLPISSGRGAPEGGGVMRRANE